MKGLLLVAAELLLICGLFNAIEATSFQDGEFVPTARRGQFHGTRTMWHDLLGRHCPRFGQDKLVAVPIPSPAGKLMLDEYKISFAIDGDRLYTPWLTIVGKRAPAAPMVEIDLTRMGEEIAQLRAQVRAVPEEYAATHGVLLQEFRNASHWPKHLLVQYRWHEARTMQVTWGLIVLFASGLLGMVAVAANAIVTYQAKLKQFLAEMEFQDGSPRAGPPGKAD